VSSQDWHKCSPTAETEFRHTQLQNDPGFHIVVTKGRNLYHFVPVCSDSVPVTSQIFVLTKIYSFFNHALQYYQYLCRVLKEGENVETGVTMVFSTSCKLKPKVCTNSILDNFDEAVLRRIIHNFYLTEKQRPTLKAIHSKICESTSYGGGVSSLRLVLRKMGFR